MCAEIAVGIGVVNGLYLLCLIGVSVRFYLLAVRLDVVSWWCLFVCLCVCRYLSICCEYGCG